MVLEDCNALSSKREAVTIIVSMDASLARPIEARAEVVIDLNIMIG